ncbi:SDR family oxidoreductase [Flavobacteriaceae bacterium]|nr:SDR family oxidoreductase [Flavobacteriaceae bacterium]MDA8949010.1 SDR family oxidoreductase [Flavobacteriaceae bacterium]MDA9015228.1 SDR family oxidoreductase [Flavobacteriaceae bacterium]MDA9572022.1 SDR family oxidoreductase [Flavobacteriaceae bacterium]MDB3862133.1 SDR family oxidoreductase [Flavobacteriaceae bacterium]
MITNKNILIIGGSSGIGLALAEQLAPQNNIYVASRSNEALQHLDVQHISFDATQDELDTSQLPDVLHGFIYCPGSINLRPFKGLKLEAFQSDFEINVLGAVRSLKSVLSLLSASGDAAVVFYSTVAVQTGMPFHSSVASSKGAIEGLTRSLAAEFAPKIRVNAIAPSLVNTPLASKFLNNEAKMDKANERHPLGRVGSAKEIAQATVFLLGEESSWMTGRVLQLDGGIGNLKT